MVHNGSSQGAWTLAADPHQEFRELCALSTTGELATADSERLAEHLADCSSCRQLKVQYERVAALAIPALAAEAEENSEEDLAPGAWSIEKAEARLMESLRSEPAPSRIRSITRSRFPKWGEVRRYAIAALLLIAASIGGYLIGRHRVAIRQGDGLAVRKAPSPAMARQTVSGRVRQTAQPNPDLSKEIASEQNQIASLRDEVRQSQAESASVKEQLRQLDDELAQRTADLNRSLEEEADLNRQLAQAQANAQNLEAKVGAISNQTAQDTAQSLGLKAQVEDLSAAVAARDKEIEQQRDLLQYDRDIRNLISARTLYIAEIYDVAKNGATQKPFGRIFYTKDKSLIFYGYDLDQQKGVKKDASFQVWGRRGADRKHDISLGLLYRDDLSQKRWVLKFNDAKTISELDAVFITAEPEGGSPKPSGKPLLFTYLHIDPNHP